MKLTTKNLNTDSLTYKNILKRVSDYELWNKYLGQPIKLNTAIKSPIRPKDDNPSAMLFLATDGRILLKDFKLGLVLTFTAFMRHPYPYNYTYHQLLETIDQDFNLGFKSKSVKHISTPLPLPEELKQYSQIIVKPKKWEKHELDYWGEYCIQKKTLDHFKVYPLEMYWLIKNTNVNCFESKPKNPIFCYEFQKETYKIYKPFNFNYRFSTNAGSDILAGENQLPWIGDLLILTKALKDVMCLYELGYTSCAVQSENTYPSLEKINQLKKRFKNILVLFDNDEPGRTGALEMKKRYDLNYIEIPKESNLKDVSDYMFRNGKIETKKLIKELLK